MARFNLKRIQVAVSKIAPEFLHTPQYENEPLGRACGCQITLKVESLNPIRCFKGRGSELVLSNLLDRGNNLPVICASAGNLGQAVAYSGRARSVRTVVVASDKANPLKLDRIRQLGAEVLEVDGDIEEARRVASIKAKQEHWNLIEDSENLDTCEGAGTIGLELASSGKNFDAVIIALGGGAMATGIGFVMKRLSPKTKIICVQPEGAPAMTLSWRQKKVVTTESMNTIADGVAGRFPIPEVLDDLLEIADDSLLVKEQSILNGMRMLYHEAGLIVEPSAALGIAALLENKPAFQGKHVATIICGSNVLPDMFEKWVINK
jgi:threonine dehydratase